MIPADRRDEAELSASFFYLSRGPGGPLTGPREVGYNMKNKMYLLLKKLSRSVPGEFVWKGLIPAFDSWIIMITAR